MKNINLLLSKNINLPGEELHNYKNLYHMKKLVLIFDCGATNVRVIAVNPEGELVASKSYPNLTREDPEYKGGRIWDLHEIWVKICEASRDVVHK